ncbi:C4-dicarboxylate ABC transporter substrate-binding protein [Synergistales bacterium]|nr:C4-dicarboxylate ABC transporter substrate-binding protein [Synergistales bacterium]
MKRSVLVFVAVGILLVAGCSPVLAADAIPTVSIATSQPGQNYMLIGNTMAEYLKGTIDLVVEPGSTFGAIISTSANDTQFGITASTACGSAREGARFFEKNGGKQENFRFVASLYKHHLRAYTTDPNLTNWNQLKGRSVTFGPTGGESFDYDPLILSYMGINKGDYTLKTMPFTDAIEAMRNRQLDVILNCTPTPFAMFDDLAYSDKQAHNLTLDKEIVERLVTEWPGFKYEEYTLETQWAHEKPLWAPYQQVTVICNVSVDDDVVYKFLSCMSDRFADLQSVVPAMKMGMESPKDFAANPADLLVHPGALKFYKEKGFM